VTGIVERLALAVREPKEVFARLFDEYAQPRRGYLAGRVGVHVADDLVAETFVVAVRRRANHDPVQATRPGAGSTASPPTCCATTSARSARLDHHRRRARCHRHPAAAGASQPGAAVRAAPGRFRYITEHTWVARGVRYQPGGDG
jgi:DNA-directed RNA polymerase specialized sigma24 family protein